MPFGTPLPEEAVEQMGVEPIMRSNWVTRTFEKDHLNVQDYCMTCGHFVSNLHSCPSDHIIVRRRNRVRSGEPD